MPCCAKCGNVPCGHESSEWVFRVKVSGARWYRSAILNLWWRWWFLRRPRARARGPAFPAWVARAVASQRGSGGRTRWQAPASRPRGDCRYGVPWARQAHPGGRARGSHPSRAPGPRQLHRRLGWPSPAAYRAVELPSPTAGQTDCWRAVRPWMRSGGQQTGADTTGRSTRVWARARHPAIRTHEGPSRRSQVGATGAVQSCRQQSPGDVG